MLGVFDEGPALYKKEQECEWCVYMCVCVCVPGVFDEGPALYKREQECVNVGVNIHSQPSRGEECNRYRYLEQTHTHTHTHTNTRTHT